MSRDRPGFSIVAFETRRNIFGIEPGRIEPIFERSGRAVVPKGPPIPNSFERRDLIVDCALVGFKRIARVYAYPYRNYFCSAGGRFETVNRDQLVIGEEGRRVAVAAFLPGEHSFPAFGGGIEMVRIV